MESKDFRDKVKELSDYCEQYDKITLFELNALFGSQLTTIYMFLLSLPLIVFSTQWIALPLSFLLLVLSIWYFFDEPLWMPDRLKRVTISANHLKRLAKQVEKITIPPFAFYNEHRAYFH